MDENQYIVGAYVAAPSIFEWNIEKETQFMKDLRALPGVGGLEIGFYGSLHRFDTEWFLGQLRPDWEYVITCLPGTMDRVNANPEFGLASVSEAGRKSAFEFAARARESVVQLNRFVGRPVVKSVLVHSAPSRGKEAMRSNRQTFLDSLRELRSWDWDGAELMVEHCDRWHPDRESIKGFLSLEDEIWAVHQSQPGAKTELGVVINWGRSALEGRSTKTPIEHLRLVRKEKLPLGLFFSGTTVDHPIYGAWLDKHTPFEKAYGAQYYTEGSLMTSSEVKACLRESDWKHLRCLGFKIMPLPKDLPIHEKIGFIRDSILTLDGCIGDLSTSSS
jgi:hypothetical protein